MRFQKFCYLAVFILFISACNDDNKTTPQSNRSTETINGRLVLTHPTSPQKKIPLRDISFISGGNGKTTANGSFTYQGSDTVSFELFGQTIGPIQAHPIITDNHLAQAICADSNRKTRCQYAARKNLQRILLSTDNDLNSNNGIIIPEIFNRKPPLGFDQSIDRFDLALGKRLNPHGRQTIRLYEPSLGVNLEAVQPEADEVGGQPLPFVDLFRVSRPFAEYSCTDIEYDEQGWPVNIPSSCAQQIQPTLKTPSYATTIMLRHVPKGAIPTGRYTVLYEGQGTITYSGVGVKIDAASRQGRDIINITPELITSRGGAGLRIMIKDINPDLPVKNIRIVMPGGICTGNPYIRMRNKNGCQSGQFKSFVSMLKTDRNAKIFNPDYLRFLINFRLIRTMNFMEASPRNPCFIFSGDEYYNCLTQPFDWEKRAKMDDSSWGGSFWTPLSERYARGAPLEMTVELANQLNRDPWFNLPHNATDDYVRRYARYVRDNLNPELKAHIEYSNEPWNGIFWAALYVREKGKALDSNPYRAGYKYYAQRAIEIFNIWEEEFGGTQQLVRVLNTYHADEWMSRNMLRENGNYQSVDVLASAPYFHGCWNRQSHHLCADEDKIPITVSEVTTVKQLFDIIDNPEDPYGMASTLKWMEVQKQVADEYGVSLYTYEGGQHLTINWGDNNLSRSEKDAVLNLIRKANRNGRMGTRYRKLFEGWQQRGGELFTLYTLPQTYHTFGTFGIKEHLNQSRFQAPKFDKAMWFQETRGKCWWDSCD